MKSVDLVVHEAPPGCSIGGRSSYSPEGRSSARSRGPNTMFRAPPRSSLMRMQTQRAAFNPYRGAQLKLRDRVPASPLSCDLLDLLSTHVLA